MTFFHDIFEKSMTEYTHHDENNARNCISSLNYEGD